MSIDNMIIPAVICGIIAFGLYKQVDIFVVFVEGAKNGLSTVVTILPPLVALMTCVGMFKASGALDIISYVLSPLSTILQLPQELIPLAVLRPISGSGAMVIFTDLLVTHGPDSYIGRIASVMEGSSETTFYTIAVYFGAVKIAETRHTLAASLTADVAGVVMSAVMVRLLFY